MHSDLTAKPKASNLEALLTTKYLKAYCTWAEEVGEDSFLIRSHLSHVKSDTMDYVMHVKLSIDSFHHCTPAQSTGILTHREA